MVKKLMGLIETSVNQVPSIPNNPITYAYPEEYLCPYQMQFPGFSLLTRGSGDSVVPIRNQHLADNNHGVHF